MPKFEQRTNILLFAGDVVIFAVALVVTLAIRYQEIPAAEIVIGHLIPFSLVFALWTATFLITGLYDQYVSFNRKAIPRLVLKTQLINLLLAVGLFFVLPLGITPKTNLAIYLVTSTVLIVLWRLYIYPAIAARHALHAVVMGTGVEADGVSQVLTRNPYFRQVDVKYIDTSSYTDTAALAEALEIYVMNNPVNMIIADLDDAVAKKLTPVFFNLTFMGRQVRFFNLTEFYETLHHRLPPSLVKEAWILEHISIQSPHYAYDALKRAIDIIGALILLVPCAFIFPIVIILIKWQDGGVIFYRTERIGQYNEPMTILKFRTMTGTDSSVAALNSKLEVTPLGRMMRKTRIDELPQLWNILRGDVSFIGPRPEMPSLAAVYAEEIPYYNMRHLVKPGLSGWAQINNFDVPKGGVDIERTIDKLSFDLYYLRHRSLLLDIEIVLKTINTVLMRTGT